MLWWGWSNVALALDRGLRSRGRVGVKGGYSIRAQYIIVLKLGELRFSPTSSSNPCSIPTVFVHSIL